MKAVERPDYRAHIKAMQDFLVADRDADIAEYQALADEAAQQGNERRRTSYQHMADWASAQRFSWETEAA